MATKKPEKSTADRVVSKMDAARPVKGLYKQAPAAKKAVAKAVKGKKY
jgi:hypothetical protein